MLAFFRRRRIRKLLADRAWVTGALCLATLRGDVEAARAFKADRDALNHSLWLAGYGLQETYRKAA